MAVIGNALAASIYGLQVVAKNVNDDPYAATRFLLLRSSPLSKEQLAGSGQSSSNKTTMAVALKNSPGMLFRAYIIYVHFFVLF